MFGFAQALMGNQQPFINPRVPFSGCIQGGLHEGKSITITGRVLPGAERFHVNLQCGSKGDTATALHFNPRYGPDLVVCNTQQHSTWGKEERKHPTPLARGAHFTLMFLVNQDSYSVIVNGAHFMEYMHRLSITRVTSISVDGGVEIQSIAFQNPASACPPQPGFQQPAYPPCAIPGFQQAPPPYSPPCTPPHAYVVPYKTIIQGGLYPGRNITIQGLVNHNADRFSVNLRFNSGIAFHFNPRFNENTVVRNTMLNETWGPEERSGGMPFYRGQPFVVAIVCDTQCYKILVNGAQMFTYNHRHFLFQQIDILEVAGDVSLTSVVV